MEIVTEPTIPQTPVQSDSANSEQPEISGTGGEMAATPELETSKNGTPDREKKIQLENSNSECRTATPDEKTGEKRRILLLRNGLTDRLKVPKSPNVAGKVKSECKTPTPVKQTGQRVKIGGGIEFPKNGATPNRLKVPLAFKYTERYTSPTDLMMSPISKGLLARTRKGAVPSKMHELRSPEMSLLYQS